MRPSCFAVLALACSFASARGWVPPANPDPGVILDEAREDACADRLSEATEKYVWFFENALKHERSYYGVRLAYALYEWRDLAKRHPPAMTRLLKTREKTLDEVLKGDNSPATFHLFNDLESINRVLGYQQSTVDTFKKLHDERPEIATCVFEAAKRPLVEAKQYALVSQYLNPEKDFKWMRQSFEVKQNIAASLAEGDDDSESEIIEDAKLSFQNQTCTLVAILTLNNRQDEANQIATASREVLDTEALRNQLSKALDGVVPKPWPPAPP